MTSKFAGWTNTNISGGSFVGDDNTIIQRPNRKECRVCRKTVGVDYSYACQCDRKYGQENARRCKRESINHPVCGYCEEDDFDKSNCICIRSEESKKTEQFQAKEISNEPIKTFIGAETKVQNQFQNNLEALTNQLQQVNLHKKLQTQNDQEQKQKEILIKARTFLIAKKAFFYARQETIAELQECFGKLETKIGKNEKIGEVGNAISGVGETISTITFGIPKAIGETIKTSSNFSKINVSKRSSQAFQVSLVDESEELDELNKICNSLISLVHENKDLEIGSNVTKILNLGVKSWSKEIRLFNTKYKIYDILIGDGVWKGRDLDREKMEKVIISLSQNLEELKTEWEQEAKELQRKLEEINLVSEQEEKDLLKQQIQDKKNELKQLIASVKEKLKSKSNFLIPSVKNDKKKEREEKLNLFFKNFPSNQDEFVKSLESIKEGLSKELTWGEINEFCQAQAELTKLQTELKDLQNQQPQQQPQTLQPTNQPYGIPSSSKK